jgi:hypothetical protein
MHIYICICVCVHRRNLANNIGVGDGAKSNMGVMNLEKEWEDRFVPVLNIHITLMLLIFRAVDLHIQVLFPTTAQSNFYAPTCFGCVL